MEDEAYINITKLEFDKKIKGVPCCLNIQFKVIGKNLKGLLFHPPEYTHKNKIYLERLKITLGGLAI